MAALVADITSDPIEITVAETHDAVAGLLLQRLVAEADLLIDFVGRRSLQLTDQLANQNRRRNCQNNMDMRFRAADFVNKNALRANQSLFDVPMRQRLDRRCQQRQAVFGVPNQVQIDLTVIAVGHRGTPHSSCSYHITCSISRMPHNSDGCAT